MDTKTKNPSRQKKRNAFISLLLVCALLITGIFAFLTATDSKTNKFTIGKIDIDLQEYDGDTPWWEVDEEGRTTDVLTEDIDANSNGIADTMENIIPGKVIGKSPVATNVGNNEEWTFISIGIPTADKETLVQQAGDNGVVGIEGWGSDEADGADIVIKAYGVQTKYTDEDTETAEGVWAKYNGAATISAIDYTPLFGEEATEGLSTRIQLFKALYDANKNDDTPAVEGYNTEAWTLIDSYKSSDGNNYYIYAYNEILPANDDAETEDVVENATTTLVDGFKLIEAIGEAEPIQINFFAEINNNNTVAAGNSALDSLVVVPDGFEYLDTIFVEQNDSIGDAPVKVFEDNELNKEGYGFEWVNMETNEPVCCNMTVTKSINARTSYTKLASDEAINASRGWLVFQIGDASELGTPNTPFAELISADTTSADYPSSPTELVVPATIPITIERIGYETNVEISSPYIISGTIRVVDAQKWFGTTSGTFDIPVKAVFADTALKNVVSDLVLPDTMVQIRSWQETDVLESVRIPYSCKYLSYGLDRVGAFYNCTSLANVTIPSSLDDIAAKTFYGTALTSITIPESVKSVGAEAFYNVPLQTIIWKSTAPIDQTMLNSSELTFFYTNASSLASIRDTAPNCKYIIANTQVTNIGVLCYKPRLDDVNSQVCFMGTMEEYYAKGQRASGTLNTVGDFAATLPQYLATNITYNYTLTSEDLAIINR